MTLPNLNDLRAGDSAAWDDAFRWLWPVAFAVARLKLEMHLPGEVEDVAIEALEELVEKVQFVQKVEELKSLTASIAHNRAVSRLRQHFTAKRGSGQTESLQARQDAGDAVEPAGIDSPVDALEQKELSEFLDNLLNELKPPLGEILADFFVAGLSYEQIARKHGLATGSVGVYLQRGLQSLRKLWPQK
jgi:RNA polymerase sigma factor (sigma-70 family)